MKPVCRDIRYGNDEVEELHCVTCPEYSCPIWQIRERLSKLEGERSGS